MSVTYGLNDNYTDIYDGKMAKLLYKGQRQQNKPKTKTTTKQKTQKQNKQTKTTTKTGGEGRGVIKQITNRILS